MKIGVDVDDVLYPWYVQAHALFEADGVTGGVTPKSWYPFREYTPRMDRDTWANRLGDATLDGSLFLRGEPIEGSREALEILADAGNEIHLVTSRGYLPHGEVAQAQTVIWLDTHGFRYHHLTFTTDKSNVRVDVMVDDVVKNLDALARYGTLGVLVNQTWNSAERVPYRRVGSLYDFATELQESVNG